MEKRWRVTVEQRMEMGEDEVRRIWKDYFFEALNIDTQEQLQATCVALIVFREVTTPEER